MLKLRRWWCASRVAGTALGRAWSTELPRKHADWREASFLVCDAEMSSLDADEGELLSLGWVCIEHGAIGLESSRHYLLKARNSVGQSATIHQLRDCQLTAGKAEEDVLELFLSAAAGRVLVFHNAALDTAFLNKLTHRVYGSPLLMPTVDTLLLEQARLRRRDVVIKRDDLRLHRCRERYKLPAYPGHNALVDALATAELFIAQAKKQSGTGRLSLRAFL